MSGFQLFADLVRSLAWPVAAILIVWFLRVPLTRLLDRIKAVKGLGGEVNFSEQKEAVAEAAAELVDNSKVDQFFKESLERLNRAVLPKVKADKEKDLTSQLPTERSTVYVDTDPLLSMKELLDRQAEQRKQRQEAVEELVKSAVGLGAFAQQDDPLDPPTKWADRVILTWPNGRDMPAIAVHTRAPNARERMKRAMKEGILE